MFAMNRCKAMLGGLLLACAFGQTAVAAEVAGIKFADTATVAGRELKLNGAGLRTKLFFKVYAAGLYLPEKKSAVPDVLSQEGPRRVTLVMMRDLTSEEFGKAFMDGLNSNVDDAEKNRYLQQISKFGAMFGTLSGLKKGDVLHLDFLPGSGTQTELNGKKIGDVVPDVGFYNAILRIWLGEHPVDSSLKPALLGQSK
ncbi:MAG: chalcone isomerase family protein [Massilia sp.]